MGITAIEMATGKPPHSDKPPLQFLFMIPRWEPPNLPHEEHWTDNFRDFIKCCTVKDVDKRLTAAQLLQHKWIKSAKGIGVLRKWVSDMMPLLHAKMEKQHDETNGQDIKKEHNAQEYHSDMDEKYETWGSIGIDPIQERKSQIEEQYDDQYQSIKSMQIQPLIPQHKTKKDNVPPDDHLELAINAQFALTLLRMNKEYDEYIVLSLRLTKINQEGIPEIGALLITNKAIYELDPNQILQCQKKINLDRIMSITISTTSLQFAVMFNVSFIF